MRAVGKKRIADYVEPRLSDASIERMWAGIQAESDKAAPVSRWWWAAAAAVLVGVGLVAFRTWSGRAEKAIVAEPEPSAAAQEVWLATGARGKSYPLGDAGRVELGPDTQVRVDRVGAHEIRLRLERGRIDCHVPALGQRRVVVRAGPSQMETTRAEFHVELKMRPQQGPVLRVGVDAGQVEVDNESSGEQLAKLGSGQTWTNDKLADDELAPTAPEPTPRKSSTVVAPAPPPAVSAHLTSDAAELFVSAEQHRRDGDPAAAAADYDRLVREHASDARAGLAAFELARIRLEDLGDPRGALEAFDAALASGKGGFFADDAEAGRVRALSRLHEPRRCSAARAAFLEAHPDSPDVAEVRALCKAP